MRLLSTGTKFSNKAWSTGKKKLSKRRAKKRRR